MGYQTFWDRVQRRALWSALDVQRQTHIAPQCQYLIEYVSYLRHVQHLRETGERRSPDFLVGRMLTAVERRLAAVEDLTSVRALPVYHYILTRTRHYDRVLTEALCEGIEQLVLFGAGADTRAFRFRDALDDAGVRVIETDLNPWLAERIRLCRAFQHPAEFRQIEFVIGRTDPVQWMAAAGYDRDRKTLFMAEGVTPYLDIGAHDALLGFVTQFAPTGSRLAYDGKYEGAGDAADAGLFRMPREWDDIAAMLAASGLHAEVIMPSAAAQKDLAPYDAPVFNEDVFVVALQ